MTNLWHGFADMGAVDGHEFVVARGDGCYVWDEAGRRYLDGTASLWYANVGFGRQEIADAAAAQLAKLHAYHVFGDFATRPVLDLADRLAAMAPVAGSKVFLTSGGSDSVDTAAKLARRYFHEIGQPERTVILTRSWAYHGMHAYGTALAGIGANRDALGELVGEFFALASPVDLVYAVIKSFLFGAAIAVICCYHGLHPPGTSINAVPKAAINAVTQSTLMVMLLNVVFAYLVFGQAFFGLVTAKL